MIRPILPIAFGVICLLTLAATALWAYDLAYGDGNDNAAGLPVGALLPVLWGLTLPLGLAAGLLSRRKTVQGLTVGVLLTALMLWGLNALAGFLLRKQAETQDVIAGPVHQITPDRYLGYKPFPDSAAAATRTFNTDTVYSVHYRTDAHSLRQTPQDTAGRHRYALFFGCSMTFGEGVNDHETIPADFAASSPGYRAYNLAFSGYGPHQMLSRLEHASPRTYVAEKEGIAFYVYIPDHVNRVIGTLTNFSYNGGSAPFYQTENGQVEYRGLFREGRTLQNWFFGKIYDNNILKLFKIGYPFRIGPAHEALTADIIAASGRLYEQQFGNNRFYVVMYPTTADVQPMIKLLRERHVQVLDYSRLFNPLDPRYAIPHDEHPTPLANRLLVQQLTKDLAQKP